MPKIKKFKELSDDIQSPEILEIENGEVRAKSSEKFEIESIIDVFTDPKDIPLTESGLVAMNADLSNKDIKRGELVYITAMVRKEGSSFNSPSSTAVIKLRIIDIYHGLAYLNKIMK